MVSILPLCFGLQNKKERKKVREVGILKKDPDQLKKQIENLEMMSKSCFIEHFERDYLIKYLIVVMA